MAQDLDTTACDDASPLSRRALLGATPLLASAGVARLILAQSSPAAAQSPQAPAVQRAPDQKFADRVDIRSFIAPNASAPASEAIEAAITSAITAGVPLQFPAGHFHLDRPIVIENTTGRDQGFPFIFGAGIGSTVLEAAPFSGAILSVRGVAKGALHGSHFFRGGGLSGLEFRGLQPYVKSSPSAPIQHGLDLIAWWGGALTQVRFTQLTGDGIRSVSDAAVSANPDFTAALMTLTDVSLVRIKGWGFIDANPIGSPGWRWDRVLFNLCGSGAWVRSSAHEFNACSWGTLGYVAEDTPVEGPGVGLKLGSESGPTINRVRVTGNEFDSNKDAHITLDYLLAATFELNRFIHHDRNKAGHLTPPEAVVIAGGGDRSPVSTLAFRQNLVRLDSPGVASGFVWRATANVTDIVIDGLVVSDETQGKVAFKPFVGFDSRNAHLTNDYRIRTRDGIVSTGRPSPKT